MLFPTFSPFYALLPYMSLQPYDNVCDAEDNPMSYINYTYLSKGQGVLCSGQFPFMNNFFKPSNESERGQQHMKSTNLQGHIRRFSWIQCGSRSLCNVFDLSPVGLKTERHFKFQAAFHYNTNFHPIEHFNTYLTWHKTKFNTQYKQES